mmetsp:Transcript_26599/g.4706  ORF Transcript_26599/g.4706 Transcript_26599/m.4706 type:complete len:80 (+) Transcript_26599:1394-1633(+)
MMSFKADTNLEHAIQSCNTANILMKDFPANPLLSAESIFEVEEAIQGIFNHMKRLRHNDTYPLLKAQNIVDLVSKDMGN